MSSIILQKLRGVCETRRHAQPPIEITAGFSIAPATWNKGKKWQAAGRIYKRELIVAGAVENVNRVREQVGECVEGFDRAFWAAGQVENDRIMARNGDAA